MPETAAQISVEQLVSILPDLHILFKTAVNGFLIADASINFNRAPQQQQPGKAIIVSHDRNEIAVKIDLDNHTTTLTTKQSSGPDQKLLLRIPIGVQFWEVENVKQARGFFFHTGDGHCIFPIHLKRGEDVVGGQTVQELILATSHVPPRIDPSKTTPDPSKIPSLSAQDVQSILKPDVAT